jgi:PPK2 family polyphosphate:nucleotide phosphotransferase
MSKRNPAVADRLTAYQQGVMGGAFDLRRIDPGAQPCSSGDKEADRDMVERLATELDDLQNLFFADKRFRMLVVLQGLDTSGKDGTLRHVFGRMSPLGVRAVGWKAPNETERSHDFLWRIEAALPADGEIVVFNRSHYEDVLVPVVQELITPAQTRQRYVQINDFERRLSENGTVIVKFMLHISKDEQRQRLQARLDDPAKRWKFDPRDLDTRAQWDAYQRAYAALLRATGSPWAPWTVVPADSKTHRNLMIGTVLKQRLQALKLRFPPTPASLEGLVVR